MAEERSHLTAEEQAGLRRFYDRANTAPALKPTALYGIEGPMAATLTENFTRLSDHIGLSLADQARERKDYVELMTTTGLGDDVALAELIHTEHTNARIAAAQLDFDAKAHTMRVNAEIEATRRDVRLQWGEKDAEELLGRANRFIAQHPKLERIIETSGLAGRKAIVDRFIDHIRRVNYR